MQYLHIWDLEEIETYIEKISKLDKTQEITIIIHSWWWENIIRDFLYQELRDTQYHLQVYQACSSALVLFDLLRFKALSIYMADNILLAAHLSKWWVDIWDTWIPRWWYEKHKFELQKRSKPYMFSFMTEEQTKKYLDWEDVYIFQEQLAIS